MDSKWVSHLNTSTIEQDHFRLAVKGASPVLKRLVEILTKDLEHSQREQKKIDHYDSPNWGLTQVDCNATQRTLERIINLCKV